jgi:hypothetical protein
MNLTKLSKQYKIPFKELESLYTEAFDTAQKLEGKNPSEELVMKILDDIIESTGLNEQNYSEQRLDRYYENLADKILDAEDDEEIDKIMDEEIQTSGQISSTLGMARTKNTKSVVVDLVTSKEI